MGRKPAGTLFQRGKVWWLQWKANGVRTRQSLDTTRRAVAERRRDELMAPLQVRDLKTRARLQIAKIEKSVEDAEQHAAEVTPRLALADVWAKHPYRTTTGRKRGGATRRTVRPLADTTKKDYRSQWDTFRRFMAERHPDARHVEDVTEDHARGYSRWLLEDAGVSAARHNKCLQTAGVMFRLAGRPDPFAGVDRREHRAVSRQAIELPDLRAVCGPAEGELRLLLALGLLGGLRLKDAALLSWCDVDLATGRLRRKTSKTGAVVSFPLHQDLWALLKETPPDQRDGYVLPATAALYLRDKSTLSKRIRQHFEKSGMNTRMEVAGYARRVSVRGFHALRHSFVTLCARAGVPRAVVAAWVGHHSTAITEIYEHADDDESQQKVLAALPAGLLTSTTTAPAAPAAAAGPLLAEIAALAQDESAPPDERLRRISDLLTEADIC